MKTLNYCLLFILCIFLLVGCSEELSYRNAYYQGYDNITFENAMDNYIEFMNEENYEVESIESGWEDGWLGTYNISSLKNHEQALTYSIRVKLSYAGEVEENKIGFSMKYDKKGNVLTTVGGYMIEDGNYYPINVDETENMIIEVLNGDYY